MKRTGFTIVELLIVIVVIAILAAIATVAYSGIQVRARDATRTSDIGTIIKALESYRTINGTYPVATSIDGPGSHEKSNEAADFMESLTPGYISSVPKDPTNNATRYYRYYFYNASTMNGYGCSGRGGLVTFEVLSYKSSANKPQSSPDVVCTNRTWAASGTRYLYAKFEND